MKSSRVRLLGATINTKTTDNNPAFLALMQMKNGVPFLAVSTAQTRLDVELDYDAISQILTAFE